MVNLFHQRQPHTRKRDGCWKRNARIFGYEKSLHNIIMKCKKFLGGMALNKKITKIK